jgi:hypothetical protein
MTTNSQVLSICRHTSLLKFFLLTLLLAGVTEFTARARVTAFLNDVSWAANSAVGSAAHSPAATTSPTPSGGGLWTKTTPAWVNGTSSFRMAQLGGVVMVASEKQIFRSADYGNTWIERTPGGYRGNSHGIATYGGLSGPSHFYISGGLVNANGVTAVIWATANAGDTWSIINQPSGITTPVSDLIAIGIAINPGQGPTESLLISGSNSIYVSSDGGGVWTPFNQGLPQQTPCAGFTITNTTLSSSASLYVNCNGQNYRSFGMNTGWAAITGPPGSYGVLSPARDGTGRVYVIAGGNCPIFRSDDSTTSWVPACGNSIGSWQGFGKAGPASLVSDLFDSGIAYTSTSATVFKTLNGGLTWVPFGMGIANDTLLLGLLIDNGGPLTPRPTLYALDSKGNIWRLHDAPESGCRYNVSPSSPSTIPGLGVQHTLTVATVQGCAWAGIFQSDWISSPDFPIFELGSGSRDYQVTTNDTGAVRTGTMLVAGETYTINQTPVTGPCPLPFMSISFGQTINGFLSDLDCSDSSIFYDQYTFNGTAGQQIRISMNSAQFDTYLKLLNPSGQVIADHDDIDYPANSNSRIPASGFLTLPSTGTFVIRTAGFPRFGTAIFGNYTVSLEQISNPTPSPSPTPHYQAVPLAVEQIDQLKMWTLGGRVSIYVRPKFPDAGYRIVSWGIPTRAGNEFTVDAIVEHFTGTSTQAVVTTAQIYDLGPLANGNYNFNFKTSGTLAKTMQFTVGGAVPPANVIDDQRQFVRQQYLDFLNREPDGPGWDFWTDNITKCSDPARRPLLQGETECISRQRETTSAAFFISPEFQNTGYFVQRVYRGSLGRFANFGGSVPVDDIKDEFTRDHAQVSSGIVVNNQLDPARINANKQAFVNQFVSRGEFLAIYGSLSNADYVDRLFQTTAVAPTPAERTALIDGLGNGSESRASVLFKIVDGTNTVADGALQFQTRYGQLFYTLQFNPAFVQIEYFGYLKRDPDEAGYIFWLSKLNQFPSFVNAEMVLAFISSPEYRARFGQP